LLVALLGAYGQFHRELIEQRNPSIPVHVSTAPLAVMGVTLLGLLILALAGSRGKGLRFLGIVALVAVMIQGLLGGFRVRLDALFGRELAPVHGIFAQIVFCLLVSLAALTGRPVQAELPEPSRRVLGRLSFALVGLLFVQLIWGAMVRHAPNALNQRLHLMTAFLAVALAAWLLRAGFTMPGARARIAVTGWVLGLLITLQVALGVEAWMGKFGEEAHAGKSAAAYLPEAAPVEKRQAEIRTAHTLIGTGVLAAAVVFALRIRQKKVDAEFATRNTNALWERMLAPEPAMELNASGKAP
jgi:heme A synthase